jgi:hypothetical protein
MTNDKSNNDNLSTENESSHKNWTTSFNLATNKKVMATSRTIFNNTIASPTANSNTNQQLQVEKLGN